MIRRTLIVLAALLPLSALAEQASSLVKIEISGLHEASGNVYIAVYDSNDNWLGDETVADSQVSIRDALVGELVQTQLELPPGSYAFSLFYDSNGNGELDTNFIGMPKEPIALSNNAKAKFGPPKFADAVFELGPEPVTQSISIKQL